MPAFCCVVQCRSRGERDKVSFFSIPAALSFRFMLKKNELSKLRREKWLAAIKRKDLTGSKLKYAKVCSKHFISGKPANLDDVDSPDWIPCLHMGYSSGPHLKKAADVGRKQWVDSHIVKKQELQEEIAVKEESEESCIPQ